MNPKSKVLLLSLLVVFLVIISCNNTSQNTEQQTSTSSAASAASNRGQAFIDSDESAEPNALRLAIQSEDHTTLVTAVQAAGVENSLVNVGPLTVFAPTNGAFDKIDKTTLDDLLKPENKDRLAYILKHHVAPSNYPIETLERNVERGRSLYMASGENVSVTQEGSDIYVGGTKIVATVKVSNGWVHIIEDVLLPEK